jgi:hypothetical protein
MFQWELALVLIMNVCMGNFSLARRGFCRASESTPA